MLSLRVVLAGSLFLSACASACTQVKNSTRIAVAGGSLTEIVYLLGQQDRLVAVDTTSNYPAAALQLPSLGYVRNLSAEGLLALSPDLVFGEEDMGPPEVLSQLARVRVPTIRVSEAHSALGIIEKIRCVAAVLGKGALAEEIISRELLPILEQLKEISAETSKRQDRPKVALLLGIRDGAPMAAGANTSGDGILSMAGAVNVFGNTSDAEGLDGWKPVSMEAMVLAAPDILVLPERGVKMAGGVDAILRHPAIRLTPAGQNGRVVSMDGMALLGFGPRTLSLAAELSVVLRDGSAADR